MTIVAVVLVLVDYGVTSRENTETAICGIRV